jgi:nicotinate-nucleotide adenylyltransferase
MNVAIFGGTFDPIHSGHLAVARAARERFALKQVLFIPADAPPHKMKAPITAYQHRFAMVAIATAGEKEFVPSDLEAPPTADKERRPSYSIETVRRVRSMLKNSDRLFFLIGMDAFKDIATWREPDALLREAEFIVVSRPGFSLADVADALPEKLRPKKEVVQALKKQQALGDIVMPGYTIHLLGDLNERASATHVRSSAEAKKSLGKSVPPAVAEYIKKVGLYRKQ